MKLTGLTTKKLLEYQLKKGVKTEFYKANRFLLFCFALNNKTRTVISALISSEKYTELEIAEYIKTLRSMELLQKPDEVTLNKISKDYKSKDYDQEIAEIVAHFNRVSNKKSKATKALVSVFRNLLTSGNYTVKDFKTVSLYYTRQWSEDPFMSKFVTLTSFFRPTKFEEKLEQSREYFQKLNEKQKELDKFCKVFKNRIKQEYFQKNETLESNSTCGISAFKCDNMPLQLQESIVHWLNIGFDIDVIINTIEVTIDSWSKNPKFAPHISLKKILDNRFPDRELAVSKKIENATKHRSGISVVDAWSKKEAEKEFKKRKKAEEEETLEMKDVKQLGSSSVWGDYVQSKELGHEEDLDYKTSSVSSSKTLTELMRSPISRPIKVETHINKNVALLANKPKKNKPLSQEQEIVTDIEVV